jgi:acetoin utilization deacetylase AcuC-like enzyme
VEASSASFRTTRASRLSLHHAAGRRRVERTATALTGGCVQADDPNVLFMSIHRYGNGFYPGTGDVSEVGKGDGEGFTVNLAWEAKGGGNHDYMAALDYLILPVAQSFEPDLLIVSAGFDAAQGDPLGYACASHGGPFHPHSSRPGCVWLLVLLCVC